MSEVAERLAVVRAEIDRAAEEEGRRDRVTLVAVTKEVGVDRILEAVRAGQRVFGENRVQEARGKIAALGSEGGPGATLEWHLIGHLQTNKARAAVQEFSLIESVDSLRLAEKLSKEAELALPGEISAWDGAAAEVRAASRGRLAVLLEVNVAGEASKSGFGVEGLLKLFPKLVQLPHLIFRGLMTVPPLVRDPEEARPLFRQLRELRDRLREEYGLPEFDQLSMGMSNDFPAAVKEGATMVRVGRAIFGERSPKIV